MIIRQARLLGSPEGKYVDLALREGLIDQVAPAGSVSRDPGEEEVFLDGRTVVPGLWDEHVHMGMWAQQRQTVSLAGARSAAEAATMMSNAPPSEGPIDVGVSYRDGAWPDEKTQELLDSLSGQRPWLLWSVDVHSCWLNSPASRLLGAPSHDGSGVFVEKDAFALSRALAEVTQGVLDDLVDSAVAEALTRGVVGVVDLDMADNRTTWIRRRHGVTDFPMRIEAGVYPDWLDAAISQADVTGKEIAPGVRVGPLKVITDGSLNTRTAYTVEPYTHSEAAHRGGMNYDLDELEDLMIQAKRHGFTPAFHAIGDEANRHVLDLFQRVGVGGRIEHAQLLREQDLSRFAALGVAASVQPQHAIDDREISDRYWADRSARVIPVRALLDHGARVLFGSDAPVSALDPLVQIAAAVARTQDAAPPWHPEQAVSVQEAFSCSARSTVAPGQPADIVALGADPLWLADAFAGQPGSLYAALASLPVDLTVIDARVSHSAL